MEYGLQLYSIRDITERDLDAALKKVAEIGYTHVEFAGFFGNSAQRVGEMLRNYGLKVSGTHSHLAELDADFAGTVKYHQTLGNTNFILPGAPWRTKAELDTTIEKLNRYQPMLAAEGITLAYHNHDGELKPNCDGLIAYTEIENRTNVDLEIDTYWAYAAGQDPVAMMTRLQNRVHVIHLKDGDAEGNGFPLGDGVAPVAAVYRKALELGMFMVVESETLQPDGITEAIRCFDYLKKLEK